MSMKDRPLSFKLWLACGSLMIFVFAVVYSLILFSVRDINDDELYIYMEKYQDLLVESNLDLIQRYSIEQFDNQVSNFDVSQHSSEVFSVFITKEDLVSNHVLSSFSERIRKEARVQDKEIQGYRKNVGRNRLVYVIRRGEIAGESGYFISFVLKQKLMAKLLRRTIISLTIVFLCTLIVSNIFTRALTNPLIKLQKHAQRIANRDWHQSLDLNRGDEIGELGETFEWMRIKLVQQEEQQQFFLQQVSHELKTPIMVINSYANAIQEGFFPKGNLSSSVEVIMEETKRLEKCVHSLLYLTKLDFLENRLSKKDRINLSEVIKELVEKMSWQRKKLNWILDLEPIVIEGDVELLRVALENLFDNQIRYANKVVKIILTADKNSQEDIFIRIWNDGSQIDENGMKNLFHRFKKGKSGKFGLGLAIVKRIIELHYGHIWAMNENNGVAFYIQLPFSCNDNRHTN